MTAAERRGWELLMATEARRRFWLELEAHERPAVVAANQCWCGSQRYRDAHLCLSHYEQLLVEWGAPNELLEAL